MKLIMENWRSFLNERPSGKFAKYNTSMKKYNKLPWYKKIVTNTPDGPLEDQMAMGTIDLWAINPLMSLLKHKQIATKAFRSTDYAKAAAAAPKGKFTTSAVSPVDPKGKDKINIFIQQMKSARLADRLKNSPENIANAIRMLRYPKGSKPITFEHRSMTPPVDFKKLFQQKEIGQTNRFTLGDGDYMYGSMASSPIKDLYTKRGQYVYQITIPSEGILSSGMIKIWNNIPGLPASMKVTESSANLQKYTDVGVITREGTVMLRQKAVDRIRPENIKLVQGP